MKKITFTCILLLSFSCFTQAQLVHVPLEGRIENASSVFEGKVIQRTSFWDAGHQHIFTSNLVKVGKVFKGKKLKPYIQLITDGGQVDTLLEQVDPSLQVKEGSMGVFICSSSMVNFPASFAGNNLLKLACGADQQGFIVYDQQTGTASDPFTAYGNIHRNLHPLLKKLIKNKGQMPIKDIEENEGEGLLSETGDLDVAAASVATFTPATVTAGTGTVLTITGSGFGTTRGTVAFSNADNGGATINVTPLPSQYVSWTDTEIRVQVPSGAGTGPFRVSTASGTIYTSPSPLTVSYNISNVTYNGTAYIPKLVNRNGSGGYTWQMNTSFYSNTGARDAFTRALTTWRCGTFVNFSLGATTTVNTASRDGIIVIRFDQGAELPAGVLGRCVSYYSGCGSGTSFAWYVNEFDITFDDAANWYYGTATPGFSQYDFQSVALHELGHGHQLGHVINTADVMHYAIANGQTRRTLNTDDINGGLFIMNLSTASGACGYPAMTALNATNCSLPAALAKLADPGSMNSTYTDTYFLMPNPFEVEASVTVKTQETVTMTISVYDIHGKILWKKEGLKTNEEVHFGQELASGIYLLQAEFGNEKAMTRIVKK